MKHAFSAIALTLATLASGAALAGEYIGSIATNGWYDARLNPGDRILSQNARYMTLMQLNGNLVTYRMSDFVMIFNTGPQSNGSSSFAQLTMDRSLNIRNNYGLLWTSGTAQPNVADPKTVLRLTDDGMLELHGSQLPGSSWPTSIWWQSPRDNAVQTCTNGPATPYPVCVYNGNMTIRTCSPEAANKFVLDNGGRYGNC